jgi:hypothetical protein
MSYHRSFRETGWIGGLVPMNETPVGDRAHLAIAKIERRLITRRGRFYKPKGMLWRTFHRLCDRYDHHDAVLNAGLCVLSRDWAVDLGRYDFWRARAPRPRA